MKENIKVWQYENVTIDFYNLDEKEITHKDRFRLYLNIYKGQEMILYDENNEIIDYDDRYIIIDYIEFDDRNNQILYTTLENYREDKINEILKN
jgi:hypothetical protein